MTDPDQYSEQEAQRRMEAAIRRAQKTPHQPHAKAKKPKASPKPPKQRIQRHQGR